MNLHDYFEIQRNSLIQEFKDDMSTCLIATTPERLIRHANEYGWALHSLKKSKSSSTQVIQKQGKQPELWVNNRYKGYRKAFTEFLQTFYNFKKNQIPLEWQVDHLQSTYRFKSDHPTYFVRLYLIDKSINASYGAGFEKMFYRNERERLPNGGIHMDWITFLKAYGEKLPSKRASSEQWAVWTWALAVRLSEEGIEDSILAYTGISTVLNLGFTGKYSPLPLHESFRAEAMKNPTINCIPQLQNA